MDKPYLIWICAILALVTTVTASGDVEEYAPGEKIPLSIHLTNSTGNVVGASCNIQVLNSSYGLILNGPMNEISGGWYNYTYNTSQVGFYFCRNNCTLGSAFTAETCNFEVEGDKNMLIAIMICISLIIAAYLYLGTNLSFTLFEGVFTNHGAMKFLLLIVSFWLLIVPLGLLIAYNQQNGGSVAIDNSLTAMYSAMIWINLFLCAYLFAWFLFHLINYAKDKFTRKKPE